MKQQIQLHADTLAILCLNEAREFHEYSDKDLENATIIFTHFLADVVWREGQKLTKEKKLELAELTGKAIHGLIIASTGKDMKEIVKQNYE